MGMNEADFLKLATMEGDASPNSMSGILQLDTATISKIDLVHEAARIDLFIESPNVKVKSIRIDNVIQKGYLFAQNEVQNVPHASFITIKQQFEPSVTENRNGVFYLHEQSDPQMTVNILTETNECFIIKAVILWKDKYYM